MLKKLQAKNHKSYNLGGLLCLLATVYVIYYLLLKENLLPFSVSSVLTFGNQWSKHWHIFAVGLVPIYLGLIIFGASVLSLYVGTTLSRWISRLWH